MSNATSFRWAVAGSFLLLLGGALPLAPAPAAAGATDCLVSAQSKPSTADDLRRLGECLVGHYSSAAQAANDANYLNVRLYVVPIWPEERRQGHYYFYAEQALATTPTVPFWQRVYRLRCTPDGHFENTTYLLAAPRRFVRAWQNPGQHPALRALRPDSLQRREGCAVYLSKTGPVSFAGTTDGYHCTSTLNGAAYATSEVQIMPTELRTWNRGFDTFGKQKWGATKGAYVFVKEK